MTWNGDLILTFYDPPPIPLRQFDWQAWTAKDYDDFCGCGECRKPPIGSGATQGEAVGDLLQLLWEAAG